MNIAIAGNEEPLSQTLLALLQSRSFPVEQLYVLTSQDEYDQEAIEFQERSIAVQNTRDFDWSQAHVVFLLGNDASYAEVFDAAVASHCQLIDLRDRQQKHQQYGLHLAQAESCDISQVMVSPDDMSVLVAQLIAPLFEETALTQVNLVTLEPVSIHGQHGNQTLAKEVAQLMNGRPVEEYAFGAQQAFNTIPLPADLGIAHELAKIFPDESIPMTVTQLQVPVFFGTTAIVDIYLEDPLPRDVVVNLLKSTENVEITDELITPVTHAAEQNRLYVQLIAGESKELQFYRLLIVTDPLKLGRVYNAVMLAEQLVAGTDSLVH